MFSVVVSTLKFIFPERKKSKPSFTRRARGGEALLEDVSLFYLKFRLCFQGDSALDIIISLHPPKTL